MILVTYPDSFLTLLLLFFQQVTKYLGVIYFMVSNLEEEPLKVLVFNPLSGAAMALSHRLLNFDVGSEYITDLADRSIPICSILGLLSP